MNIAPAHLTALQALGYTETEARFLYIVATHSGYFVARQFLAFTDAHWGKRTTLFWNKLQTKRHARTECFPKSGTVYHLFSRRLYRQIDRENIRNRREHEIEFIQQRIAMLDFVLLNQGYQYLETEPEKVSFFCNQLKVPNQFLPSKIYHGRRTSEPTVRYFVDKFPMFVAGDASSPVVTFTYIHDGGAAFVDFVHHLESYLPLFRQLSEFHFVYASRSDSHFAKATELFNSLVKIPLESDIAEDVLRYFRVRKAWDEKRYGAVSDADLIFSNHARSRFSGQRFEGLYRGWKNGHVSESNICQEFGTNDRKRKVEFQTFLLNRIAVSEANAAIGG